MTEDQRDHLLMVLDNIMHLEHGLALCCRAIDDPDQLDELLRAKENLKLVLWPKGVAGE